MKQFDVLEIQKNIEEKRLILGKKFEDFLLKNLSSFSQKFSEFLATKNFCFWSVSIIFLLSIYLRSMLDIGGNSAFLAARIFKISPIISAEILINFLGITSLIISALVLKKSALNQVQKNVLLTSFAVGIFLPIHALGLNEFFTKTSFALCLAYPCIALSFLVKRQIAKIIIFSITFLIGYFLLFQNFFFENLLEKLSSKILFFGGIFLVFLRQKFSADDKILFSVFIVAAAILLFGKHADIGQMPLFFGLIIPVFAKIFCDFLRSENFRFGNQRLVYVFLLFISVFVPQAFLIFEKASIFWWIIIPILAVNLSKKDQQIINPLIIVAFILLVVASFTVTLKNNEAYLFLSAVVMFIFVIFYEKNYAKFHKNFSEFFVFVQFFLASTLISLIVSSAAEAYKSSRASKSPNYLTDHIAHYSKIYAAKNGGKIFILSDSTLDIFPTMLYSKKQNFLSNDLQSKDVQLIFVNSDPAFSGNDRCSIGLLETKFQDQKFKKIFFQNYKFIGRIFASKVSGDNKNITFFEDSEDESRKFDLTSSKPIHDFEIYARKNY